MAKKKTSKNSWIMNVGELIEQLKDFDPHTPIWVSTFRGSYTVPMSYRDFPLVPSGSATPLQEVALTTSGDPISGRHGGDPSGPPSLVLTDQEGAKIVRSYTKDVEKIYEKARAR